MSEEIKETSESTGEDPGRDPGSTSGKPQGGPAKSVAPASPDHAPGSEEPTGKTENGAGDRAEDHLSLTRGPDHPVTVRKPRKDKGKPRKPKSGTPAGGPAPDLSEISDDKLTALIAQGFSGSFEVLAMMLGQHWRLTQEIELPGRKPTPEAVILAEAWLPIFRLYGAEAVPKMMVWISAGSVSAGIVLPRIRVSVERKSGVIGWIQKRWSGLRNRSRRAA